MTNFGLALIVVALVAVVVMFGITLDLRAQRDAAQAYVTQIRSELDAARMRRQLQAMATKQGGAK